MKTENWNGHLIRFVENNGEWWAVLKDVCDALELRTDIAKARLSRNDISFDVMSFETGSHTRARKTQEMLIVFEINECFNEKSQWSGVQTLITPKGRETFRLLCAGM